jgi:biotin carboxylase
MRVVHNPISLRANFQQAHSEAEAAFGEGTLYLEKYIELAPDSNDAVRIQDQIQQIKSMLQETELEL